MEALLLLQYLQNNPPSYQALQQEAEPEATGFQRRGGQNGTPRASWNPSPSPPSSNGFGSVGGPAGRLENGGNGIPSRRDSVTGQPVANGGAVDVGNGQQQQTRLNMEATRQALMLVNETVSVSTATLQEVQRQAEQIDRIERNVDNIHANLDKTDRILRGMESIPAYFGNKWSKKGKQPPPVVEPPDRSIKVEKSEKPLDIEILCKNPNDSFSPALLRLFKECFMCVDVATGQPLSPDYAWSYSSIDAIVMRSRPEHCDIRFKGPKERFRMMASYLQIITNELVLRTPKGQIHVTFETGAKTFDFGHPKLSAAPTSSRAVATGGFVRKDANAKSTATLLSANADDQTRRDFQESDQALDSISELLEGLNDQQRELGVEVDRQVKQLDGVTKKVDDAMPRLQGQVKRMDALMK